MITPDKSHPFPEPAKLPIQRITKTKGGAKPRKTTHTNAKTSSQAARLVASKQMPPQDSSISQEIYFLPAVQRPKKETGTVIHLLKLAKAQVITAQTALKKLNTLRGLVIEAASSMKEQPENYSEEHRNAITELLELKGNTTELRNKIIEMAKNMKANPRNYTDKHREMMTTLLRECQLTQQAEIHEQQEIFDRYTAGLKSTLNRINEEMLARKDLYQTTQQRKIATLMKGPAIINPETLTLGSPEKMILIFEKSLSNLERLSREIEQNTVNVPRESNRNVIPLSEQTPSPQVKSSSKPEAAVKIQEKEFRPSKKAQTDIDLIEKIGDRKRIPRTSPAWVLQRMYEATTPDDIGYALSKGCISLKALMNSYLSFTTSEELLEGAVQVLGIRGWLLEPKARERLKTQKLQVILFVKQWLDLYSDQVGEKEIKKIKSLITLCKISRTRTIRSQAVQLQEKLEQISKLKTQSGFPSIAAEATLTAATQLTTFFSEISEMSTKNKKFKNKVDAFASDIESMMTEARSKIRISEYISKGQSKENLNRFIAIQEFSKELIKQQLLILLDQTSAGGKEKCKKAIEFLIEVEGNLIEKNDFAAAFLVNQILESSPIDSATKIVKIKKNKIAKHQTANNTFSFTNSYKNLREKINKAKEQNQSYTFPVELYVKDFTAIQENKIFIMISEVSQVNLNRLNLISTNLESMRASDSEDNKKSPKPSPLSILAQNFSQNIIKPNSTDEKNPSSPAINMNKENLKRWLQIKKQYLM